MGLLINPHEVMTPFLIITLHYTVGREFWVQPSPLLQSGDKRALCWLNDSKQQASLIRGWRVNVLTLIGAVGVGLVAVVTAVVVTIACPVVGDAATAVTFELWAWTGVAAACLVAVVTAVVICKHTHIVRDSSTANLRVCVCVWLAHSQCTHSCKH